MEDKELIRIIYSDYDFDREKSPELVEVPIDRVLLLFNSDFEVLFLHTENIRNIEIKASLVENQNN